MQKFGEVLRTDGGKFQKNNFADYCAVFAGGFIDEPCLKTFGLINTAGTRAQRSAMRSEKLLAIKTTILDWIRKLRTGDLL